METGIKVNVIDSFRGRRVDAEIGAIGLIGTAEIVETNGALRGHAELQAFDIPGAYVQNYSVIELLRRRPDEPIADVELRMDVKLSQRPRGCQQ